MWTPKSIRNESTTEPAFPSEDYINRRVSFRFDGCLLKMDLSLGLFSSAGVDTGSRLLLKTLAREVELDGLSSIVDLGCGAGTLGLALAARCPRAHVHMVDRDAMATAFSRHNAALNKLANTSFACRLLTEIPADASRDLAVCNFPAKAGDSVLKAAISHLMGLLTPEGRCALVIVHTLAGRCRELIFEAGGEVLLEESSTQHTVYHFRGRGPVAAGGEKLFAAYIRHHGEFRLSRTRYAMDTVWNLDEFDTLSWGTELLGKMLGRDSSGETMVFVEPGQGHFPTALALRRGRPPKKIILAGRDRLALLISRHNLKNQTPGIPVDILALPVPEQLGCKPAETQEGQPSPGETDFLLTRTAPVSRSNWTGPLRDTAARLVKPGGIWAIVGKSSDLSALTRTTKGWTPLGDRRLKGTRALVYRKNR